MKKTLLLASRNRGKLREFRQLFADLPELTLLGPDDVPSLPDVIEDGLTFADNARKKALEMAHASGLAVLADDSGLEVDALGGAPGVHSARYAGTHGDDEANNEKLLRELSGVPDVARTARYRVVLAFADPAGPLGATIHLEDGACEGRILHSRRGQGGFGYDSLFLPEGHTQSMAELSAEQKNTLSHRALATQKMRIFLARYLASHSA
jgi:XTP/dITP diphosphohydrolase